MNKNFGQSGEKPRINYHIIEIIIFGDTVKSATFSGYFVTYWLKRFIIVS